EDSPARAVFLLTHREPGNAPWVLFGVRWDVEHPPVAALVRDLIGNPFRPPNALNPAWRTPDVLGLARSAYYERAFDRLPILGDALEDAGCTDAVILDHCRGPGPHVRGCWVVDLILGKS